MLEISAALIAVAGSMLIWAGAAPGPMSERARSRILGLGVALVIVGVLGWMFVFGAWLPHISQLIRAQYK